MTARRPSGTGPRSHGGRNARSLFLATLTLGIWSRRLKLRLEGTPASTSYFRIKFGLIHVLMFPLAGLFALVALLLAVSSLADGRGSTEQDIDDGCGSVELALEWLWSADPSDQENGTLVAAEIWDRSATDDAYSIHLRQDCPVEVMAMIDLAGLSYNP